MKQLKDMQQLLQSSKYWHLQNVNSAYLLLDV